MTTEQKPAAPKKKKEPPKCVRCNVELVAYIPPDRAGSWYRNIRGEVIIATRCPKCGINLETPMSAFPIEEEPFVLE